LTAAALLSPLVRPPEFPYTAAVVLPEPVAKIRDSLSIHRAFQWTLQMYRQHRGESAEISNHGASRTRGAGHENSSIERH
jgi:hypothetical protein